MIKIPEIVPWEFSLFIQGDKTRGENGGPGGSGCPRNTSPTIVAEIRNNYKFMVKYNISG